ncbi:MAG: hypothetical protein ABJF04_04820 [Reichenbachiella sp.]|uniref:hypothetical protein n=1 Tax=Reichenbachiella sp. TaxID=2184521 RepID=UPI00326316BF
MKKICLLISILYSSNFLNAQILYLPNGTNSISSSPSGKLELRKGSQSIIQLSRTGGHGSLAPLGQLDFYDGAYDQAISSRIAGTRGPGAAGRGELAFYTLPASGGSLQERMRIDYLGNVAIGKLKVGLEDNLPSEGNVAEGDWGNYILSNNTGSRTLRFGVSNDSYTRGEIEIDNNNSQSSNIIFKTTNQSGGAIPRMVIKDNGNIGIGTTNPGIHNSNATHQIYNSNDVVLDIQGGSRMGWISTGSSIDNGTLGGIAFTKANGQSDAHRQVAFIRVNTIQSTVNTPQSTMEFATKGSGSIGNPDMVITPNGSIGIGTTATGSHKLAVDGSIGAREIKVEMTLWEDRVFREEYELRSLEETEKFISNNFHLPEIPSESDVIENGINLGQMNAKLLQKIEELTLYLIEQNKRLDAQQKEIEELKAVIKN